MKNLLAVFITGVVTTAAFAGVANDVGNNAQKQMRDKANEHMSMHREHVRKKARAHGAPSLKALVQ